MDLYTHFTSPLRRYADVLVHRLLAASIGVQSTLSLPSDREKSCDNLNYRHRQAQFASRASTEMFTMLYLRDRGVECVEAYVVKLSEKSVTFFIPKYGLEAIHDISTQQLIYDPSEMTLFKDGVKWLQVLQKISVNISIEQQSKRLKLLVQFL